MSSEFDRLSRDLERWWQEEARARIRRWRGADVSDEQMELLSWVSSSDLLERLENVKTEREANTDECIELLLHASDAWETAFTNHLENTWAVSWEAGLEGKSHEDVIRVLSRASQRNEREVAARDLVRACERGMSEWLDRRAEIGVAARSRFGIDAIDTQSQNNAEGRRAFAAAWLDRTIDLRDEAFEWMKHLARERRRLSWGDLFYTLRARELDGHFMPAARLRRIAAEWNGLGFGNELSHRVRMEPGRPTLDPYVECAFVRVPEELHVAPSYGEYGLISEVSAVQGVGMGLAHALVSPALPFVYRRPVHRSTLFRGIGDLMAQALGDKKFLVRQRSIGARERELVCRLFTSLWIMESRLWAVAIEYESRVPHVSYQGLDDEMLHFVEVLGFEIPLGIFAWIAFKRASALPQLRGRIGSLVAYQTLRNRFDEDWYRNPQAGEAWRSACHRGGLLGIEGWCNELSSEPDERVRISEHPMSTAGSSSIPSESKENALVWDDSYLNSALSRLKEMFGG